MGTGTVSGREHRVRAKRIDAWVLFCLGIAFSLALVGCVLIRSTSAAAVTTLMPKAVVGATAETTPAKLPRSGATPITLRAGFTSEALESPTTPELSRIVLEFGRSVNFQTVGLPSCSFAELYSRSASPGHSCAKSLVGKGIVDSEITLPGRSPAKVEGHLSAFYVFRKGERRILARVRTGAPLPLIYVIPFKIAAGHGVFGTSLAVRRMRIIQGICIHPNCFSPYTLKGVYGHISKFELSLHRTFVRAGEKQKRSFVSARCPAASNEREATPPLLKVSLDYFGELADEGTRSATVARRCRAID
jgi:hypothetical protein